MTLTELPAPPVASALADGWRELAAVLPVHVRTATEQRAYRALSASRGTTAAAVAAAYDLETREIAAGITAFRGSERIRMRVLFVHGGGLIAGNRFDGVDVVARHARELGVEVWTTEYPLAPESGHREMLDHLLAVTAAATADGIPLSLAGQSAGGGLAASLAVECRERCIPIAGQLLICPMLDDRDTVSARQFADDPSWSSVSNRASWAAALAEGGTAPGERTDLHGLAPTFLDVGSAEVFRDSVVTYAGALWAAGVSTELHVWSGGFHASDCVVADAVVSQEAHRARERWLRRLIDGEL